MIKLNKNDLAFNIGEQYAEQLYKEFWIEHPEYRGPNMTLENFPDFVKRIASSSMFMSLPGIPVDIDELENIAASAAYNKALKLINE